MRRCSTLTLTVLLVVLAAVSNGRSTSAAQSSKAAVQPSGQPRPYLPPRTPWGDPQLAGVYSNDDETGVPFERPAQFEGRRIEDISPEELAALNKQRNE